MVASSQFFIKKGTMQTEGPGGKQFSRKLQKNDFDID
jgi:hypothetical protein